MNINEILIGVFFPANEKSSFIYDCIEKSAKSAASDLSIRIKVEAVDQNPPLKSSIIDNIKSLIEKCDLAIFDFTDVRHNVIHEFGYAEGKDKDCIIITQNKESVPFNVNNRPFIEYTFSIQGLSELESKLKGRIINFYNVLVQPEVPSTLLQEKRISEYLKIINNGLKKIESDSLLKGLISGELKRISNRMLNLESLGKFDLRTHKPVREIIDYYVDYISQLDGSDCELSTVTHLDFWRFISDTGRNGDYFKANERAAKRGTVIKRLFNIPSFDKNGVRLSYNRIFNEKWIIDLLKAHYDLSKKISNFEVKIIFTDAILSKNSVVRLDNYALWSKGSQKLFFRPQYGDEDKTYKKLITTDFSYWKESNLNEKPEELAKLQNSFKEDWNDAHTLNENHFTFSL